MAETGQVHSRAGRVSFSCSRNSARHFPPSPSCQLHNVGPVRRPDDARPPGETVERDSALADGIQGRRGGRHLDLPPLWPRNVDKPGPHNATWHTCHSLLIALAFSTGENPLLRGSIRDAGPSEAPAPIPLGGRGSPTSTVMLERDAWILYDSSWLNGQPDSPPDPGRGGL